MSIHVHRKRPPLALRAAWASGWGSQRQGRDRAAACSITQPQTPLSTCVPALLCAGTLSRRLHGADQELARGRGCCREQVGGWGEQGWGRGAGTGGRGQLGSLLPGEKRCRGPGSQGSWGGRGSQGSRGQASCGEGHRCWDRPQLMSQGHFEDLGGSGQRRSQGRSERAAV